MTRNIHVIQTDRGWAVEVEGTDGGTSHYPSQEEAIAAGWQKAKQDGVELLIHGRDGKIRERTSYWHEPRNVPS